MTFALVATENGKVHHTDDFDSEDEARESLVELKREIDELLLFNSLMGHSVTDVRVEHTEDGTLDAVEFDSINVPGVVVRYQVQQLED